MRARTTENTAWPAISSESRQWNSALRAGTFARRSSVSHSGGGRVQLSILVVNFGYAVFGVILMFLSYRLIDKLTPQVDFPEELRKGNIAVAIFIAAIFVSIAIIIGNSLN